jgi:hypothetical protein
MANYCSADGTWYPRESCGNLIGLKGFVHDKGVKIAMTIDEQKIDQAVLALLYLTLHDACRAWKSFDFGCMNRLHEKGYIDDPVNKAKSVVLTEKGLEEAERLFKAMFVRK